MITSIYKQITFCITISEKISKVSDLLTVKMFVTAVDSVKNCADASSKESKYSGLKITSLSPSKIAA